MNVKQVIAGVCFTVMAQPLAAAEFNVRDHGAKGDGVSLDSPAINAAIDAAAAAGGGTVVIPPGTYLSFSIRLKSHIELRIEAHAVLLAATPDAELGVYDPPEPNDWGDRLQYQDFGHSHWHNSLLWGENVDHVTITGGGLIDGKGLLRNVGYSNGGAAGPNGTVRVDEPATTAAVAPAATASAAPGTTAAAASPAPSPPVAGTAPAGFGPGAIGQGNKAIAFKNSSDIVIRDITISRGGHFAVLVTGVDRLELRNLTIDTNRDGIDIDATRDVRISDCRINAPHDDAIVLKSSYALGALRDTENVDISNCTVSGFDLGTLLDGTHGRTMEKAPDRDGPAGRIKIGTESNGAFRHITIRDCTFLRSRGLALETVDGGIIEDVRVRHLTMREVSNAPIFLRLGNRARGPAATPVGRIRRVTISDVTAEDADSRYAAVLLAGLPGHPIEDITLENIRIAARGGLTPAIVAEQPANLVNSFFLRGTEAGLSGPRDPLAVPLREQAYPEPSMFGLLPAGAVYARHVRNLRMKNVQVSFAQPDSRPRVVLDDVDGARFDGLQVASTDTPPFVLHQVRGLLLDGKAQPRD